MNNPEKILHGFLELSVSGDQLERFLNLCHARAVSLERIRYLSEKNITTRISINVDIPDVAREPEQQNHTKK